MSSELEYI
jgi:CRISPR/Cas system-associated endonuclease Cas1